MSQSAQVGASALLGVAASLVVMYLLGIERSAGNVGVICTFGVSLAVGVNQLFSRAALIGRR
jgi:hypothetical protein